MSDLVVITGASSGIGLALARAVPFPAAVVDVSRSGPPDDDIEHLKADLADPSSWGRVRTEMKRLVAEHDPGRAVFIHAAGTLTPIGFAGEVDFEAYAANVVLNSASGQVLGNAFLEAVHGRTGIFDVVMITSGAASSVYPGWSSYGAGKAALDHWVRNVGSEQRERGGVRVSAIAPGVVATDMQSQIREMSERDFPNVERFHELHDEGRLADPDDAARKIWDTIEEGIDTGAVTDIRNR